jgi:GTP cyclohydrolase IA|tara:strand:+ start:3680 stop:4309 length:630 start_codon:yes stop_codon:yes gene_type:complete
MRNKEFVLPTANSSAPRSDKEKQEIISKATIAYEAYLDALGFDWRNDPNSSDTPRRVAKAFVNDLATGCYQSPPKITTFPSDGYDGIVSQCNIPVKSMCSHHHLAFTGKAHVAYIPSLDGRVIGLSKLNRIVEYYARRPQIQEGLTVQIHKAISEIEMNQGVAVVLECQHTCACLRGVRHDGCVMKTSKLSGDFMNDGDTRQEFYEFIR